MDVSPNAPRIEDGALRYATTHPTNSLLPTPHSLRPNKGDNHPHRRKYKN